MIIHLIEDDAFKCTAIKNCIQKFDSSINLEVSLSVASGLRYLVKNKSKIDLLLLDMSMPLYDNSDENTFINEHQNFGGKEILSQMKVRKINIPVVVITMFNSIDDISINTLEDDLKKNYPDIFKGIIFYTSKDIFWAKKLTEYITEFKHG
ncbi:hypothetical protein [Acinetobacter sp. NIOH-H-8]|uniref:hypothetical protein n=1 Tax=Acinetobacter sp. NIOH-H-8 TaxID=3342120 RepID=UPI003986505B